MKTAPEETVVHLGRRDVEQGAAIARLCAVFDGQLDPTPPPELIKRVLPRDGIIIIGGQSGAGKTFLTIDMCVSLASGDDFFGLPVRERVGVLYLAAEGASTIDGRIKALKLRRQIDDDLPIAVVKAVPNLSDNEARRGVIADLRTVAIFMRERWGIRVGAIVVDTISAAFEMTDEGSNAEAAAICRKLREIGDAVGALMISVHHYGKDVQAGLRGASAWRGNVDSVLSVLADRNQATGETTNRSLALAKSRTGEEGPISGFVLDFIKLGIDQYGDVFGACVIEPLHIASRTKAPSGKGDITFHDAFNEVAIIRGETRRVNRDGPQVRAVRIEYVRTEFMRRYATGEFEAGAKSEAAKKAWQRALRTATKHRLFATENDPDSTEWIWKIAGEGVVQSTGDIGGQFKNVPEGASAETGDIGDSPLKGAVPNVPASASG